MGFYTPEGEPIMTVPAGQRPHETVLSADGEDAFVTYSSRRRTRESVATSARTSSSEVR